VVFTFLAADSGGNQSPLFWGVIIASLPWSIPGLVAATASVLAHGGLPGGSHIYFWGGLTWGFLSLTFNCGLLTSLLINLFLRQEGPTGAPPAT
jgi:hypothetical protein